MLAREFEIKDLGTFKYVLGMEVAGSKKDIVVSQWKYVHTKLTKGNRDARVQVFKYTHGINL